MIGLDACGDTNTEKYTERYPYLFVILVNSLMDSGLDTVWEHGAEIAISKQIE